MSWSSWEIHGFGLNLSDIEEKFRMSTDDTFIRNMLNFIVNYANTMKKDTTYEHSINDYDDVIAEMENALSDPDGMILIDGDEICDQFANYENELNNSTGFDALIGDIFMHKWITDGHDKIADVQRNDDGDGELYWMLLNVEPWHRCEFASQQDCEATIRSCFFGIVDDQTDIDSVTVQQSG